MPAGVLRGRKQTATKYDHSIIAHTKHCWVMLEGAKTKIRVRATSKELHDERT